MSIPVWAVLAFAMWTIALLIFTIGVQRWSLILTGRAELKSFRADEPHGSPFYRRAMRAHANCIENLPVFGSIVLAIEVSGAHSSTLDALAVSAMVARIGQTGAHLVSGSNTAVGVRFAFLAVQLVAFFWMGALVALHASGQ